MILVILCLVMITSAILIRIIMNRRKKTSDVSNSKWLYIGISVLCFIYVGLISYFVTDINIGFIYTYLSFVLIDIVMYVSHTGRNIFLNSLILIIGIPITSILLLKSSEYFLINSSYILFLVSIPSLILFEQPELEHCVLKYISLTIGMGIAIYILLVPHNLINSNNKYIQEVVAEEYLINKLHITPVHMNTDRNLRGKATEVRAYSSRDLKITMIYRNGKIESYKLEE